jgi:multisubunit Na+/H+ antiporter MnhB subunit
MDLLKESQLSAKPGQSQSPAHGLSQSPARNRLFWRLGTALALASGAALRLWMMRAIPQVEGDTLLYGNLARNLLLHGQFAIADGSGVLHQTLLRLPGYPLFLAACFHLFGVGNYNAVILVQIAMELAGCLLLAGFAQQIAGECLGRAAAQATLWLSALCPFTASYSVAPLTETATLFAIALALWSMSRFDVEIRFHARPSWPSALAFTFAVSFAALLRPDGALVGLALTPGLLLGLRPALNANAVPIKRLVRMGALCALLAVLPFAVWAVRNWRVFHAFEPLAPRYANDPGEPVNSGWQRWMKTWCLDFVSTYQIYWNVPDGPFDLRVLPARAFDTPAQRAQTEALAAAYNDNGQDLSPAIDAGFARLAEDRVQADPLRFYLWLPLGRMADMWFRPRVENLNIDLDWWVYKHHNNETIFSWSYVALNAIYVLLGLAGLCLRPKYWQGMLLYLVLRSALLATLEAPEARYTLECFPMLFVLGAVVIATAAQRVGQHNQTEIASPAR